MIYAGHDAEQAGMAMADLAIRTDAKPLDPDDIDRSSFIIYTSGTTGRAKGVLLSIRGMLWIAASCWAPICELTSKDVVLSPLPLFHSYGLNLSVLSVLAIGASEHLMEKFSPQLALELMQSGRYTIFPGVPTMFHYLLHRAQETDVERLGNIRLCISAGAIMPATLNRAFEERFKTPLLDGYGITETSTMVTMNWLRGERPNGSCGLPVPGLAVRIVDPNTLEDVPIGDEGELIVRGPNLMQGYHNKPAETASALRKGWYHTGDLARSDPAGYLTITGRIKELIIRGGQNIAPAEIEEVVVRHPQVKDCAVVGIKHATLGEVPCLFVVAKSSDLDVASLMDHCRAHLSSYKIPEATHSGRGDSANRLRQDHALQAGGGVVTIVAPADQGRRCGARERRIPWDRTTAGNACRRRRSVACICRNSPRRGNRVRSCCDEAAAGACPWKASGRPIAAWQ